MTNDSHQTGETHASPAPYYSDEYERTCECGCGKPVVRRFVSGHNRRGTTTSAEHRTRLAEAQRRAWLTKRDRKPLGSRRKDVNGYWLVKVREGGGRWDKEHVLVAEREAGRRLRPGEHVHHINCVRDDNRPENLVIMAAGAHAKGHGSLNALVAGLISDGLITFDRSEGVYRRG